MATLKYKIIKTKTQYKEYCSILEELVDSHSKSKSIYDEIDLLTLLVEKWDEEHNTLNELDPIQLLHALMEEHGLKPKHLVELLGVSKGYISDFLHYKKGLSKEVIRALSAYFKVSQEGFNRPYKLKSSVNLHFKNGGVMNRPKPRVNVH